jgi:DNA-binding transcriptional LysR family regulator
MEDRDWLIIKVLHEQKNVTKAAQALFISQPALTARIHQIEDYFGVKMIYRGSKGIHFTPEGDYLAKCSQDMLTTIRRIKEQVTNMGAEIKGTLRIGASNYLSQHKLPRLLGLFKERYPNVEIKVITNWSRGICSLLYNQDVHMGFVRSDFGWQGEKHILEEEPICVASKQEISLPDLPKLSRIDYHTDDTYKTLLAAWWNEQFSQPPKIGMMVSYLDICKAMVINGLGYAIVPDSTFNDVDGPIHRIYITDKEGKPILRRTWMLYQKEILELKIAKLFIEFAKTMDFNRLQ